MSDTRDMDRPMDHPHTTNEPMRTNPEATAEARAAGDKQQNRATGQVEMWPDMGEFHERFEHIQSEFIDDPKAAVKKAERLMEEAVERITKSMRERMQTMHRDIDGKDGDTETLRQAMRGYRTWIESMWGRRAA